MSSRLSSASNRRRSIGRKFIGLNRSSDHGLLIGLTTLALLLVPMVAQSQPDTTLYIGTLEDNVVGPTRVQPGEVATVGLFYSDPSDNIQGFTITLCYDDLLTGIPGTFTTSGTILDVIGAEFVTEQVDDDPNDGDGKEIIIGILLDASPPFDGQTVPPTLNPLQIGSIQFQVPADTPCFTCLSVLFCDGINGNGQVLLSNRVIINSNSVVPAFLPGGEICVPKNALFVRGDSNNDSLIDVADVVHLLLYLFRGGDRPDCLDAADFDNDGLINITDPVFMTLYIFEDGLAPPSPFPDCGLEPIPDADGFECFLPTANCPACP